MQDGDVRDGDVDGDARVEIAAVVFGEGRVGRGEDDGAGDFVAGGHCAGCGWVVISFVWYKGMFFLDVREKVDCGVLRALVSGVVLLAKSGWLARASNVNTPAFAQAMAHLRCHEPRPQY